MVNSCEFSYLGTDYLIREPIALNPSDQKDSTLETIFIKGTHWGDGHSELLILDELNRASVPQVFGELLYALSQVDGDSNNDERKLRPVRLQYSQEDFYWPDGLHIIATLNQADRSTEDLDQALQRRFKIRNVPPDSSILSVLTLRGVQNMVGGKGTADDVVVWLGEFAQLECSNLSSIMEGINTRLLNDTDVFDADKKLLGQGLFLKSARVTAKSIPDKSSAVNAFISEMKEGLVSQLHAICNNRNEVVAKVLLGAIESGNLKIPKEIIIEVLDALPAGAPLRRVYFPAEQPERTAA